MDKCIACGLCAEKCPAKMPDEYNQGLAKRKAIYVPYAQAVPLKYAIDASRCIYFIKKGKCKACEKFCPAGAIKFDDTPRTLALNVGAIILAPGFRPFDPSRFDTYSYARHANVITAAEFERVLSASGPTQGHLVRMSDHTEPRKIAWLQCVGSRDLNRCDHAYCSSVCCMYAVKEAVIAKEHAGADLDCAVFFMDMRTPGKEFERYYDAASQRHGIRFIRSRVHTVKPLPNSDDLEIRYVTEDGRIEVETFNQVVLSVGMETPEAVTEMAQRFEIDLTRGNFCQTSVFEPVATSRPGIFVCGAFQGPRDIPQSVVDASAAAAAAGETLTAARNTLIKAKPVVPETNVINDRPAIGVFICRCGINIAGVVDVPAVAEYAASLPYVTFATDNLYACSQDTQDSLVQIIQEKKLNRVVVAACTPKTHEPLFQETLVGAGLNKYLFEMANIRNQDSWVHKDNPDAATQKAKDLVRMAVAKVALMQPLVEAELAVNQKALVIGGGISGMAAARTLARQGYETHIVEREGQLGGQALNIYRTASGEDVQPQLQALIEAVTQHERVVVHLNSTLTQMEGFVGNFQSTLTGPDKEVRLEHGVALLATGAQALQPTEYAYGQDARVLTSLELDRKLIDADPQLDTVETAVFIQCVGSREPQRQYCSRVCCTHSIDNALTLKRRNPAMQVYILYRDIRTYGEREYLYKEAREAGVIFIRYTVDNKPRVTSGGDKLLIQVTDHVLQRPVEIAAEMLVLASAIVPNSGEALSRFFKVPLNEDGFFVERHAKLGPSEFATDGVFLCGLAHYPKPIDEAIAQGRAAASRAVTLLARENIHTSGTVAQTSPMVCSSCGVCISLCPYSAPSFIEKGPFSGKAEINPVLCKGCGLCVASCRSGALHLKGFDNDQVFAQIFSMVA